MYANAREARRLLGVDQSSSLPEIKRAFRTAVKKYHPDVRGNAPATVRHFQNINRVYAELIDYKNQHPDVPDPAATERKTSPRRDQAARAWQSRRERREESRQKQRAQKQRAEHAREPRGERFEESVLRKIRNMANQDMRIDPLVRNMSVESLVMRCDFSANFYVKREAIKALVSKGSAEAARALVHLRNGNDAELRLIVDDMLRSAGADFRDRVENDSTQGNIFTAWVDKLISGIVRVFESSVRISY